MPLFIRFLPSLLISGQSVSQPHVEAQAKARTVSTENVTELRCSQSIRPFLMLSNKPQRSDLRFPKSSPLRFGPRLREIAPVRGRDAVSRNLGAGHGSHCLDPDSEFSSDPLVEFLSIMYYCFLIGSFSRECCWGKLLQSIREMRARFHTINSGLSEKEPLFPQSRSHGQSGNASIFMPI